MTISRLLFPLTIALFATSLLGGCQSTTESVRHMPESLLNNNAFTVQQVEDASEIFALTPAMQQQLDNYFPEDKRDLSATRRLLKFLLKNGDTSLNYQSGATLTASQTYQQLNANCLSLSILAYAMAEHLGLHGQFQRVHIPEYWALDRGYNLLTGHVNLKLRQPKIARNAVKELYVNNRNSLVVDFDPDSRKREFPTTEISKERVAAMFYNNKGAAAMVSQDYDLAYSYFVAAIKTDSAYSGSWGNLGILMRMNDRLDDAETAYNYAIDLDSENNTALGNLAILYDLTGRAQQAEAIKQNLTAKRRNNPYYFVALGNEAYVNQDYEKAIAHYKRAQHLDPKIHDSYFGLARTYFKLGDMKLTKLYLSRARQNADFDYEKDRYQRKLDKLDWLVKQ